MHLLKRRAAKELSRSFQCFVQPTDLPITIDDIVTEGDKICARTTTRGTHRGPLFGIAATGKAVAVAGLIMDRFAEGRIV